MAPPDPHQSRTTSTPTSADRDAERLFNLLAAEHPAISIIGADELDALSVAERAADRLGNPAWTWTVLDGVRDPSNRSGGAIADTENAASALFWLARQDFPTTQIMLDLAAHLDDPRTLRAFRRLAHRNAELGASLIMIDHTEARPRVVHDTATRFELTLPDEAEVEQLVRETLRDAHAREPIDVDLTAGEFRVFIKNLLGLPRRHVRQITREVVNDDRRFDAEDLNHALAVKRRLLGTGGTLEYVESPATLDDVGGLASLKQWLAMREHAFTDRALEFGLTPPRGVLLLGVQGAGKSLCAKAIATAWRRPLLRLDPGSLYDRFVGESERRLRDGLAQAEAMAPIVLWIDEIEKGFASAAAHSTDGGLSQRLFGTFLTWMQDHTAPVFLVATANNIDALPPELLRKGRFDEIFFVDLPDAETRRLIFEIHLRKRRRKPGKFDLDALGSASDGFSGAEIEQAVVSAIHVAFAAQREPTTDDLLEAVRTSPPLSVTMAEKIADLRAWATHRCVPAN